MIQLRRFGSSVIALIFLILHPIIGLINLDKIADINLSLIAMGLYLVVGIPAVVAYRGLAIPKLHAVLNAAAAVAIPILLSTSISNDASSTYASWFITGIAALMAVTAVRQARIMAWFGLSSMIILVLFIGGIDDLANSGILGAISLLIAGHFISIGLENANIERDRHLESVVSAAKATAQAEASQIEREARIAEVLGQVGPMLTQIISKSGRLSEAERQKSRLLEASLRDDIRGRTLLNQRLRTELTIARSRGIEAVILDEGGLLDLSEPEREEIRDKIADALSRISEGRVTIRAPKGEKWAATLVATRSGTQEPDVWLRFPD